MDMFREQQDEQARAFRRIVARAWIDDAFRQRLLANPADVLKAEGIATPEGVSIQIMENTESTIYLTLPARPGELSDEQLAHLAGGTGQVYVPGDRYNVTRGITIGMSGPG